MKGASLPRFYYHVLRRRVSQIIRRRTTERTEQFVRAEYTGNYERESNEFFMFERAAVLVEGRPAVYPVVVSKRSLLATFASKLAPFEPASILELGSGRGYNLMALAVLMPELRKLQGVELSPAGVAAARRNRTHPSLAILSHMTGYSRREVGERLAGRDISYEEGSIRALPFPDQSFDAVFSNSVLEQIPRDYNLVFREARRVARTVGVFSEPFREAQRHHPFKLMHLKNIDYFRSSYEVARDADWRIYQFEIPSLQKFMFNTGFLTCIPDDHVLTR